MPPELNEIIQRSLITARELQSQIETLSGGDTATQASWEVLVQAHTAHVLNHTAILKHVTSVGSNEPTAVDVLHAMATVSEQMIRDARFLHEYVIRGLKPVTNPSTPDPSTKSKHRQPSMEELDENKVLSQEEDEVESIPAASLGRRIKTHWKKSTEDVSATRNSPKRQLRDYDTPEAQALVKRTKLTPATTQTEKRKSDISMADVESAQPFSSSPLQPPGKRQKRQQLGEVEAPPAVQVEYEDITAEVDARMQQREERKEHERKLELGIIDKRKRQSNDSFTVELSREDNAAADKPSRKRKKHRHSDQPGGANCG